MLEKICSNCKATQPVDNFGYLNISKGIRKALCTPCDKKRQKDYYYKNRKKLLAYKDDYYEKNKPEILLSRKEYRKNNPEKVKESFDNWLAKNPDYLKNLSKNRKANIRANSHFLVTVKDIRKILNNDCVYCGSRQNIQLEHVIPVSRGGSHSVGNLAPACAKCNNQKNKWFVMEWKLLQKKWSKSF